MSIAVRLNDVSKLFGEFVAVDNVSLDIGDGEFFALLGPSGCGKTTILRMVAGFEQPTMGEVFLMGKRVAGIPAHKRPINTVFQSYALFPHMTAAENVAFGLQMSKVGKHETAERVTKALEMVQMGKFIDRTPKQLSGGQKQRIALARALVNRPSVLLLDEPLGALDLKLRKQMQMELKQIQSDVGITFIYVTHDQEEALTMSDRIAVMDGGVIRQLGTPREIYEHPTSRFVADFIGETNFIDGVCAENAAGNEEIVRFMAGEQTLLGLAEQPLKAGQAAVLAIRPEKMQVVGKEDVIDTDTPHTLVDGVVQESAYIGTDTRYKVRLAAGQELFVRVQNLVERDTPVFDVGDVVNLYWPALNAQVLVD